MQALADIPRVLQKIEDLRKSSTSQVVLNYYKKNFKLFIQALTKEVSQMIDKYQFRIKQLTKQNQYLKQAKQLNDSPSPVRKLNFSPSVKAKSPQKQYKNIDMMQTAKSNVFGSNCLNNIENGVLFSSVLAKYKKSDDEDNHFPIELISGNHGESVDEGLGRKSRFMAKSNIKKQKEEELRHYIQAGNKNLQKTTRMLLSAIGRDDQQEVQLNQINLNDRNHQNSESSLQIKRPDSSLNKSLGNICQSLDTSFHSKKARSKNVKKRQQVQEEIKKKQKQDEEVSKMLRERGVKNLLRRLRDNVQNSTNPPQIIKSTKLISCGKNSTKSKKALRQNVESQTLSVRKNSKVMINPVPVDIAQKSKATRKDSCSSPTSPEKKPQSILKHSSVLSRSLLGISAIQFV